jgi:hypothetical protein
MKRIFFLFGTILLLFPGQQNASAALDCEEDDRICSCMESWSRGFDVVTDHMIDNVLSVYFSQNEVAPGDMWSGYRSISLMNQCYLGAVCDAVMAGQDSNFSKKTFAKRNSLGGSFPGPFSACALEVTLSDLFGQIENGTTMIADVQNSCAFSRDPVSFPSVNVDPIPPEERTEKMQLYDFCQQHRELSSEVFNRALQNYIWKDTNRKVIGQFTKKTISFIEVIEKILESAEQFSKNANAAFGRLCTLSNPDT